MRFIFYSPVAFEKWDWRNSVEKGIGGSETSHVEMSWRLAKRGHEVITYAPIPDDCPGEWRNTKWYPIEKADLSLSGVWILYRCPDVIDKFLPRRKDQKLWLLMQDWDYPNWTKKRIKNTDRIITLCKSHGRDVIRAHPEIKKYNNLWLSSNGVKADLIKKIEKEEIKRNPKKIIHTSSPDRALRFCLKSFQRAREIVPDLEFHAYYGFNNLNKLVKADPNGWLADIKKETEELMKQPGFFFHGRITQEELYREWFSAGIWIYETDFNETSCISCMEAQSCGAIPIYSPKYGLGENVGHGVCIDGPATDPLTHARFAAELAKMAMVPQLQDEIRKEMIPWARKRFDWEVFVTQWELEARDKRKEFEAQFKFPSQL